MKQLFLVLTAMMAAGAGSASAQVTWGLRVGASKPTIAAEATDVDLSGDSGFYVDMDMQMNAKGWGLEAGPTLYCGLSDVWYIHSGAAFSIKVFDFGDGNSLRSNWIEIPLHIGSAIPLGSVHTYLQAGPYVRYKLSESLSGAEYDAEHGETFKSFNAGLGIMYGVNIKKIKIEAGYQYGLTKANANASDDVKLKVTLRSLFVGIGYVF